MSAGYSCENIVYITFQSTILNNRRYSVEPTPFYPKHYANIFDIILMAVNTYNFVLKYLKEDRNK